MMRWGETALTQDPIDLGGGFALVDDPSRGSLIEATALLDSGVLGYASPATVDARLDADALAWIAGSRLASDRKLISLEQVHGSACAPAREAEMVSNDPALARLGNTDAVWTGSPDDVLIVRTADCAALWLVDPEHERLAMIHAGWRGAADGIIAHTVEMLRAQGSHPDFLVAAIGPHIGPCCLEVGPDVAQRFDTIDGAVGPASMLRAPRQRDDSVSLNLAAVLVAQLRDAGVLSDALHTATACTRCFRSASGEFVLHSYRRNGAGGPLMGSIGFLER